MNREKPRQKIFFSRAEVEASGEPPYAYFYPGRLREFQLDPTDSIFIHSAYLYLFELAAITVMPQFELGEGGEIYKSKWDIIFRNWLSFCRAKTFDEAFEKLAGIDYSTRSVKHEQVLRILNFDGPRLYNNRKREEHLCLGLQSWVNERTKACRRVTVLQVWPRSAYAHLK